ncbi:MAG: helix-turn-helix domain-containing protein [Methanobrevibacter sp. CfCl-M3]
MSNKIQKKVKMHVKKSKLTKLINKHDQNPDVVRKLTFIRFLYNGKTVPEVVELMEVALSTGHRWLDEWNEGGYEGLFPKYKNGGRKAKLTERIREIRQNNVSTNLTLLSHEFIKSSKITLMLIYSMK